MGGVRSTTGSKLDAFRASALAKQKSGLEDSPTWPVRRVCPTGVLIPVLEWADRAEPL